MIPLRKLSLTSTGSAGKQRRSSVVTNGSSINTNNAAAVLVVGSTGSGKSSTIAKCTGQAVKVGDHAQSVTRQCAVYPVSPK